MWSFENSSNFIVRGACVLGLWTSTACVDGKDLWLGAQGDSLKLDRCTNADCGSAHAKVDATLRMPDGSKCDGPTVGTLVMDSTPFSVRDWVCGAATPDTFCDFSGSAIAPTSDGGGWLMGFRSYGDQYTQTLWLLRYGAKGENLGTTLLGLGVPLNGGQIQYKADLKTDARGHAFVVVHEMDAGPTADYALVERAWLAEYSDAAILVGAVTPLAGVGNPHLALAEGKVLVAADAPNNAHHGLLAQLDPDTRELLWSQTNVRTYGMGEGQGIVGMGTDARGNTTVLSQRDWNVSEKPVHFGLARYDHNGVLTLNRVLDGTSRSATFGPPFVDALGNVTLSAWFGLLSDYHVLRVTADGAIAFVYSFEPGLGSAMFGDAESGTVYLSEAAGVTDQGWFKRRILSIAVDGTCVRYDSTDAMDQWSAAAATREDAFAFIRSGSEVGHAHLQPYE